MAIDYRLDLQRRIVYSTSIGPTTAKEIMQHQRQLREDPQFAPDFDQLFDMRLMENQETTAAEVKVMAEQSAFGAGSRRAFVVTQDVHYGMVRMFELLRSGGDHIMAFRDMGEARRWLKLDEPDA